MPNTQEKPGIHSPEEQEKQVYDILGKDLVALGWFKKEEIKIVYIDADLFAVGTEKNITLYCDRKWYVFFNVGYIRSQPFFQEFLSIAGYGEMKNTKGEYKLFRIHRNSLNPNGTNKGEGEIPLYSKEYFSAWKDIEFYRAKLTIDIFQKPDTDKKHHPLSGEKIQELSDAWSLRARDLISLLEHGQITQKTYDTYIWKAIEQLPKQIVDLRFDRIRDSVTIPEIQELLRRKMITKGVYDIFFKRITARDELLGDKEFVGNRMKKDTWSRIDMLKKTINGQ